jgi:hypothetical protein
MKQAPILLMMLCIAAWAVMAVGAAPMTSLVSGTSSTQTTISPNIKAAHSPTFFQYLIWIVSPTIRLVVGNMVMQSDAILTSERSNRSSDIATSSTGTIQGRVGGKPEMLTDRPKPHTQSSERAVPSIPDG